MSNKKAPDPADESQAENPAPASGPDVPASEGSTAEAAPSVSIEEFDSLKKELEEARAQAAEYKDGWQRAVAEFSNYRKRLDRDNETVYQNAVAGSSSATCRSWTTWNAPWRPAPPTWPGRRAST